MLSGCALRSISVEQCHTTSIIQKIKQLNVRNIIIGKHAHSRWILLRMPTLTACCLALCCSFAEYSCPVRAMTTHSSEFKPATHDSCRGITGCLMPAYISWPALPLLALRELLQAASSAKDRLTYTSNQFYNHVPSASRLGSPNTCMHSDINRIIA